MQSIVPYSDQLITAASALMGVAVGGLSAHLFSLSREREARRHSTSEAKKLLYRERGEELFSQFSRWQMNVSVNYLNLLGVMRGKYSYNDYLDMIIKNGVDQEFKFDRLELLLDVYFPEMREIYDRCSSVLRDLNSLGLDFRRHYEKSSTESSWSHVNDYIDLQKVFEKSSLDFKDDLAKKIRNISVVSS